MPLIFAVRGGLGYIILEIKRMKGHPYEASGTLDRSCKIA